MDAILGPDVPHAYRRVSTACAEQVERWVEREAVDSGEVPVVVADHAVVLEVPAAHHLVLTRREEVGRPIRNCQTSDGRDVASERQLQCAGGQVPDLDGAVGRPGGVPRVGRVDRHAPDPAHVARNDPHHLPWGVPFRLGQVVPGLTPPRHQPRAAKRNRRAGSRAAARRDDATPGGRRAAGPARPRQHQRLSPGWSRLCSAAVGRTVGQQLRDGRAWPGTCARRRHILYHAVLSGHLGR
mmetsp:Transcript_12697/g.41554  ORF Transcript_12697/g.41554 Transcript_12697/m.41554 type:complete len:240 (-) Transcript_12697:157-876(-)